MVGKKWMVYRGATVYGQFLGHGGGRMHGHCFSGVAFFSGVPARATTEKADAAASVLHYAATIA
jgi:hypothetical protein